jgi:acyl carrier protein
MTPEPKFTQLVRRRLKYAPTNGNLNADLALKDYGLDSGATIDLLLDLEDTYGITMPDEYLSEETFATLSSLWQAVSRLVRTGDSVGSAP